MLSSVRSPASSDKGWLGQEPSGLRTEELSADRGGLEDEDFLNAGDSCVGPDIGQGHECRT